MPRRRALTGAQLAGLLALPATEAELQSYARACAWLRSRRAGAGGNRTAPAPHRLVLARVARAVPSTACARRAP